MHLVVFQKGPLKQSIAFHTCRIPVNGGVHFKMLSFTLIFAVQQRELVMPNPEGSTIRLHRVLRAPAERVYKAFTDADALTKWLPPNGFIGKVHEMDAKVGGGYRMSFTNLGSGHAHSFASTFTELKPFERISHMDKFDDPALAGEMHTTIVLKKVSCGTDVEIVQEGIPEMIPADQCYLGWQDSLRLLMFLVEAEIPE